MPEIDALVTGGTGVIGRWLLPELTADGQSVAVLLRGHQRRLDELRHWVAARGGAPQRLHGLAGDLAAPDLGLDAEGQALARTARRVYHLGAAMAFDLTPHLAAQVNVAGSLRVTGLAAQSARLERLVLVSTFQHRRSRWPWRSRYHDSKLDADTAVRDTARAQGLPLTTVHPGPVVGDSRTGRTTQFWGWPDLVGAVARGRLPIVPGGRHHWLPLAAVDYVARFLARAPTLAETADGQYWLLHADTPPLAELLGEVADELGTRPPKLHLPTPVAALGLRAGLDRWTGIAEALTFLSADTFPVASAQRIAAALHITEPDPRDLARRTARFLADNHFRPPSR